MPNAIHPFDTELAHSVAGAKYMRPHGETHWYETADRAVLHPMNALQGRIRNLRSLTLETQALVRGRRFIPGGRYLYASGNDYHQVQNCLLLDVEDTREAWSDLSWKEERALLTGAGVGVYYGKLRPNGYRVRRTGGVASGPLPKMIAGNELGRSAVQGGDRRSARWAGLPWWHADVLDFIVAKDWPEYIKEARKDYMRLSVADPQEAVRKYPAGLPSAPLDMTNISVCLDDAFFLAFHGDEQAAIDSMRYDPNIPDWLGIGLAPDGGTWKDWAFNVYWSAVNQMTQTGEPGFSVDVGEHRDEKLRNACTEIVSADDGDICNLGGLVLARFEDNLPAFERACRLAALYLTAGTVYSDVPYTADEAPAGVNGIDEVREKNRRLGIDLLGVDELLIRKGVRYGSDEASEVLAPYYAIYERCLEFAWDWQDQADLSRSVAATSGAPTGTRGLIADTTTGHQKVTAKAFERDVITSRAHKPDERSTTYVIDPSIARAIRDGKIAPDAEVEDSYDLADDYERIFRHQAEAQEHTDQAISMTVNLPRVMTDPAERREFGNTLLKYLPRLRGITVYPDGAISGQPIKRVSLAQATRSGAAAVETVEDDCAAGVCAI